MSTAQYFKPNRKAPDVARDLVASSGKQKVTIKKDEKIQKPNVKDAIEKIEKGASVKLEFTHKRCRKCSKLKDDKETGCSCGRPLFGGMDVEVVLAKLEQVFSLDATDDEACLHAGISTDALYRYERSHPEFRNRKKLLRSKQLLLCRTVFNEVIGEKDERGKPTDRALGTAWRMVTTKNGQPRAEFGRVSAHMHVTTPVNALTDERKAEIATAMQNWSMIEEGDERDEDYESPDN